MLQNYLRFSCNYLKSELVSFRMRCASSPALMKSSETQISFKLSKHICGPSHNGWSDTKSFKLCQVASGKCAIVCWFVLCAPLWCACPAKSGWSVLDGHFWIICGSFQDFQGESWMVIGGSKGAVLRWLPGKVKPVAVPLERTHRWAPRSRKTAPGRGTLVETWTCFQIL